MENFTPTSAFLGGVLIGAAALLLMLLNGRVTGISGIAGGLLEANPKDRFWRLAFVGGLVLGALAFQAAGGSLDAVRIDAGWPLTIAGGLLVGIGTHRGHGCTSGHGVCGMALLSKRSLAATGTFMLAGFATVFVMRHVVGG